MKKLMRFIFRKQGPLQKKAARTAVLLALLSIALSFAVCFTVSARLLRSRAQQLDTMFLEVTAEQVNTYLGEIADLINLSVDNTHLDFLIEESSTAQQQPYRYVEALGEYKRYLTSLIVFNDNVDNIIYIDSHTYMPIHEGNINSLRETIQSFYGSLPGLLEGGEPFYLLPLDTRSPERIAIVRPILTGEEQALTACVALVPSHSFFSKIRHFGAAIHLVDRAGAALSLYDQSFAEINADAPTLEQTLIFEGWSLNSVSLAWRILREFTAFSLWLLLLGGVYVAIVLIVARLFAGRLILPLEEMNASMQKIAKAERGWLQGDVRVDFTRRHVHFRRLLLIFYSVVVAIPAVAFSTGFYWMTRVTYEQNIGYFYQHYANTLFDQMELSIQKYKQAAVEFAYNGQVQQFLYGSEGNVSQMALQAHTRYRDLMNLALFDRLDQMRYSSFYSQYYENTERRGELLSGIREAPYATFWETARPGNLNRSSITLGIAVFAMPPLKVEENPIGCLLVDIDTTGLLSVINSFERHGNAAAYLYTSDQQPVFLERTQAYEQMWEQSVPAGGVFLLRRGEVLFEHTLPNGWIVVAEIQAQEYFREQSTLLINTLVVIVLLLAVCFVVSYLFSATVTGTLESLMHFVRQVLPVQEKRRIRLGSGDEIEELGDSFNDMLDTLQRLAAEQMEAQRQVQNARLTAKQYELNLLQSQINPHFLYNTLKTVQYMVHVQDPRAENMVRLLIHLFRTGISRQERLVTLEEELGYVQTYLEIQRIRFSDKFKVRICADRTVRELYLLKMTLQPIVENAIYHGLELLEKPGLLEIFIEKEEDLVVRIRDNGLGIEPGDLAKIRERLENGTEGDGIGLYNVHERLRLYFGSAYGVWVESLPGDGTCVTLRYPLRTQPDRERPVQME